MQNILVHVAQPTTDYLEATKNNVTMSLWLPKPMESRQENMSVDIEPKAVNAPYVKLQQAPPKDSLSTTIITLVVLEVFFVGLVTNLWAAYEIARRLL